MVELRSPKPSIMVRIHVGPHRDMAKPKNKGGVWHIFDALRYSWQGIRSALKREEAFRLELIAFIPFLILAFFIGSSPTHIALLIVPGFVIFLVEMLNTAIEATVDRIGDEIHPLSRIAKDSGSAAVTFALMIFAVVWATALYEKFGYLIFG